MKRQARPAKGAGYRKPLLIGALFVFLVSGYWIYATISEVGLEAFLSAGNREGSVKLKSQPVYRVKKRLDLLGMKVIRVISKQQPQEFLIVEGVSSKLVDKVFAQKPDLAWANLMANQFLKLREAGEGGSSVSVEIQDLKTLNAGSIRRDNRELPYWQMEIRFKLSNEPYSRYYQAGVVRDAVAGTGQTGTHGGTDTLLVGYAQKEAFQKNLIADLMSELTFERN